MGNNSPSVSEIIAFKACEDFNNFLTAKFPPHPLAVAPSDEAGYNKQLRPDLRNWLNKEFGAVKMIAARRYKCR